MESLIKDYLQEFGKDVGKPKGIMQNLRDSNRGLLLHTALKGQERGKVLKTRNSPTERADLREKVIIGGEQQSS